MSLASNRSFQVELPQTSPRCRRDDDTHPTHQLAGNESSQYNTASELNNNERRRKETSSWIVQ
jgi:hypothetical protein